MATSASPRLRFHLAVTFCRSLRRPCGSICDTTRVTPSPDGPTGGTRRLPAWPPGRSAGLWAGSADGVGPGTPGWETDGRSAWATALGGGQGASPCLHPHRPRGCDAGPLGAVWELRLRVGTGLCHCPRTLRGPTSQGPSVQSPEPRAPGGGQYQHRRRWGSQTGLLEGQSHSGVRGRLAQGSGPDPFPSTCPQTCSPLHPPEHGLQPLWGLQPCSHLQPRPGVCLLAVPDPPEGPMRTGCRQLFCRPRLLRAPASVPGLQDRSPRPLHTPHPPGDCSGEGHRQPVHPGQRPRGHWASALLRPQTPPQSSCQAARTGPSLGFGPKSPTTIPLPTPLAGPPRIPRACSPPGHPEVRPPRPLLEYPQQLPTAFGKLQQPAGTADSTWLWTPFPPETEPWRLLAHLLTPRPSRRLPTLDTRDCPAPTPSAQDGALRCRRVCPGLAHTSCGHTPASRAPRKDANMWPHILAGRSLLYPSGYPLFPLFSPVAVECIQRKLWHLNHF